MGTETATVLDLDIKIVDNVFDVSVYDKTNNFSFKVVKFPSLLSNIPDTILYNVYFSQVIRYLNICNTSSNFLNNLKYLSNKCMQKGAKKSGLLMQIRKLFKIKPDIVQN